jgi:phosphopantetheinyl transferase (holo-ACP synthase)
MIGVDAVTISRFDNIDLKKLGKKLGVELTSPKHAAKTWACLEAIYKASPTKFYFKDIKIAFKEKCPPEIIDVKNVLGSKYILSLTHEKDLCIAVAIKDLTYNQEFFKSLDSIRLS